MALRDADGFPADAQGNVSQRGDVSVVLAKGLFPLSSFTINLSGAGEGDVFLPCSALVGFAGGF